MSARRPFLQLSRVSKHYGGVTALDDVEFACDRGRIHAILGENGAGKSTLIKIASGVVAADSGELFIDAESVHFNHPRDAQAQGVVTVFQELSLLPTLSVADNIGIADATNRWGLFDKLTQCRRAEQLLARVGCEDVDPRQWVSELSLSRRQLVELAKALGKDPKLLILDEATSALSNDDVSRVFEILRALRDEGVAILYISHRMSEIERLADVLSVFRNGKHIETFDKGARSNDEIVQLMIGRDMGQVFPDKPEPGRRLAPFFQVRELGWQEQLRDVSFELAKGEIVGIAGLDGQGQRELLLSLFGVLNEVRGEVLADGKTLSLGSPHQAKSAENGLALVPEDRKTEGLMLGLGTDRNISLSSLDRLRRGPLLDTEEETRRVSDMLRRLCITVGDPSDPVTTLSGGNQQKVVLAKWLMTEPKLLMLNDPTRGIDVGTKQEIYRLLRGLADAGTAILFHSTDYEELIGCSDRVLVFYQGRIVRQLVGDEIDETNIVKSALNMHAKPAAAPGEAGIRGEASTRGDA